ncbi:MAG: NUDIX domain-containing protein [Methylococcales symbiont of Iophon sp. n. MRB-2018]|nr:MAG: NUDIX domain-containing protein [Methylococcales symbiont of Iophon sp. n. MRB-2018]KAF3980298.1 MAG: NUDIX domain-containing protein [Methylococcales symbiont of Iophon sp. n. MRB-2018]
MKKEFKINHHEIAYSGFFRLQKYQLQHTLFKGGWSPEITRELFMRGNCVAVILYDPNRDEVVLIEQFRTGAILRPDNAWLIEIVAGAIEPGETAEEVAYREAEEEAGCKIEELLLINEFYTTPGGASERISLFCGKVDSSQVGGVYGLDYENEDILVSVAKFDDVYQMVETGDIESGIPIIAIQWLYINRDKIRKRWAI